jgi:hypothetical protein
MCKAKRYLPRAIFICLLLQLKKPLIQRLILLHLSALVAICIGCTVFIPWHVTDVRVNPHTLFGRMAETWHR